MISKKYESENFPFGVDYLINQLSVEMRASMEAVTNGQTIEWYKVNLENGKISEATSSQAPSYASPKLSLARLRTGVRSRATSVAKNMNLTASWGNSDFFTPLKQVFFSYASSSTPHPCE